MGRRVWRDRDVFQYPWEWVCDPFPAIPMVGGSLLGAPSLPRGGGWFLGSHRCLWRWLLDTHLSKHCLELPLTLD